MDPRKLTRIALIAAVYVTVTMMFQAISFGIIQVRISEALTVLPYFTPIAIWGLFIGCFLANLLGGFGLYDIVFGSLATLVAAFLTSKMPKAYLAPLPPVVVNALVVGGYLSIILHQPYWFAAFYVGLGQVIACYALGYPLLLFLKQRPSFLSFLRGDEQ